MAPASAQAFRYKLNSVSHCLLQETVSGSRVRLIKLRLGPVGLSTWDVRNETIPTSLTYWGYTGMRWEMGTKQYSTVYRVQGIPMEYRKKQLKEALTSIFHLLETENFVRIYSLAPNYTWSRSLKVATITFDKEIEVLSEGKKEACFVVPTGDTDDDDDDGAFSQRVTFKLDVHFEGLTPLRAFRNERDHLIDVVAVTGLGGHAYGSFKERGGDHMWLRDSLPQDLEAAQIYLYGYDSHLSNSQSFQGIVALATTLRQRLQRLRRVSEHDDRPVPRPLIFIAHSLGGILVKEALVQMQDDPHDQRMLKTVFGALFFGVPNHGMDITSLRTMVRGQPNENLVTQLGPDSDILDRLASDFDRVFNFSDSRIVCFCETALSPTAVEDPATGVWKLTGPPVKLVGNFSAKSGRPRDRESYQLNPINRNHSDLVKFPLYDDVYETVRSTLRGFASIAPRVIYSRFPLDSSLGLHEAAKKGNVDRAHLLLSCGVDPDESDADTMTPMHLAAQRGHVELIRILANFGASIDQEGGQNRETPLHCAVAEGCTEAVQTIVENGADIHAREAYGDTALHLAAELGHADIIRILVQYGARIDGRNRTKDGKTVLQAAVEAEIKMSYQGKRNEALDTLVALGADVNVGGGLETPLHCAVRAGSVRAARILLNGGANVNVSEPRNFESPLHAGVIAGNAELTCLLLEKGAYVNARDSRGRTPLFLAAEKCHSTVIPELLRYDPDIFVQDFEHKLTALEISRRKMHSATMQVLEGHTSLSTTSIEEGKIQNNIPSAPTAADVLLDFPNYEIDPSPFADNGQG